MYNKNEFKRLNDKKILHKIKKHWVTISIAMLGLIGGGAVSSTNASANITNQNIDNDNQANHSLNINQQNRRPKLVNSQANIHNINNKNISVSNSNNSKSLNTNDIIKQANILHKQILGNVNNSVNSNTSLNYDENFDKINLRNNRHLLGIDAPGTDISSDSPFISGTPYDYDNGYSICYDHIRNEYCVMDPANFHYYAIDYNPIPNSSNNSGSDSSSNSDNSESDSSSDIPYIPSDNSNSDNISDNLSPVMRSYFNEYKSYDPNDDWTSLDSDYYNLSNDVSNLSNKYYADSEGLYMFLTAANATAKLSNIYNNTSSKLSLTVSDISNACDSLDSASDRYSPNKANTSQAYLVAKDAYKYNVGSEEYQNAMDSMDNDVRDVYASSMSSYDSIINSINYSSDSSGDSVSPELSNKARSDISDINTNLSYAMDGSLSGFDDASGYLTDLSNLVTNANSMVIEASENASQSTSISMSNEAKSKASNDHNINPSDSDNIPTSNSSSKGSQTSIRKNTPSAIASIKSNIRVDYNNEFNDETTEFNDVNKDIQVYDDVCINYNIMTINPSFFPSDLNSLASQNNDLITNEHNVEEDYIEDSNTINSLMTQLKSTSPSTNSNVYLTRPRLLGAAPRNDYVSMPLNMNLVTKEFDDNIASLSSLTAETDKLSQQTSNEGIKSYANELHSLTTIAQIDSTNYDNSINKEQSYSSKAMSAKNIANVIHNKAKNANFNSLASINNKTNYFMNLANSYATNETNINSYAMQLTSSVAIDIRRANDIYNNARNISFKPVSNVNSFERSVNSKASSLANATTSILNTAKSISNETIINSYSNKNKSLSTALNSLVNSYNNDSMFIVNASEIVTNASNTGSMYASQAKSAENQTNNSLAGSLQGKATNYEITAVKDEAQARSDDTNIKLLTSKINTDISEVSSNYQYIKGLVSSSTSKPIISVKPSNKSSKASMSASNSNSNSFSSSTNISGSTIHSNNSSASSNSSVPVYSTIHIIFKNLNTGFVQVFSDTNKVGSVIPYKSYLNQLPLLGGKYIMNKDQHDDTYLIPGKTEYVYITSQMDSNGLPPQDQSSSSTLTSNSASLNASKSASVSIANRNASTIASESTSTSLSLSISTSNNLSKSASLSQSVSTSESIFQSASTNANQSTSTSLSISNSEINSNMSSTPNASISQSAYMSNSNISNVLNNDANILNSYDYENNSYANDILLNLSGLNVSNNSILDYVKDHISEYSSQIESLINKDSNEVNNLYSQSNYSNSASNSNVISNADQYISQASSIANKASLVIAEYIKPLKNKSSEPSQTSASNFFDSTSASINNSLSVSSLVNVSLSDSIQNSIVISQYASSVSASNAMQSNLNTMNTIIPSGSNNYKSSMTLNNGGKLVYSGYNSQSSNTNSNNYLTDKNDNDLVASQDSLNDMNTHRFDKASINRKSLNDNNSKSEIDSNESNQDPSQSSDINVNNIQHMDVEGINHDILRPNNPVNVDNKLSSTQNNFSNRLPQTNEILTKSKELAEILLIISSTCDYLAIYIDKHRNDRLNH